MFLSSHRAKQFSSGVRIYKKKKYISGFGKHISILKLEKEDRVSYVLQNELYFCVNKEYPELAI